MTQLEARQIVTAADEVARLMKSLEALANPCCRGHATSEFKVMGRDGQPTGEEVTLCDGCGRELNVAPALS
jgi:hypothetical protein